MLVPFNKSRNVFIHDFDGVHYRYQDNPEYVEFFTNCGAIATFNILQGAVSLEEAHEIHVKSYFDHGAGHFGFLEIAAEQGISEEDFKEKLYKEHSIRAYDKIRKEFPSWLKPCYQTQAIFSSLQGSVRHGLVTHSDIDGLVKPFLKDIGLLDYFDPNCLLGFQDIDFESKALSPKGIALAMRRMNVEPYQVVFIDDSYENLRVAKRHYPDICTSFISEEPSDHDYVDVKFPNLLEFNKRALKVFNLRDSRYKLNVV